MRQLFKLAREKKPSIIFIDEIDALCSNRDSGSANAEDTARIKTEFLVQMDGLGNDNEGVFLLGATNLPWALDPAVRRRFQKRIHAPLPDEKARGELFKVHLGEMSASLGNTEWAYRDLAMRTNGFSGSDIANLVQDALMIPIKKIHTATHFKKVSPPSLPQLTSLTHPVPRPPRRMVHALQPGRHGRHAHEMEPSPRSSVEGTSSRHGRSLRRRVESEALCWTGRGAKVS